MKLLLGLALACSICALSYAADPAPSRVFVPQEINLGDWSQIEPLFIQLRDRKIENAPELEKWLFDWSELDSCLWDEKLRRENANNNQTDNLDLEKNYTAFIENIIPKAKPYWRQLKQKYFDCPSRSSLDAKRYAIFNRDVEADLKTYREINIPLSTEDNVLRQKYAKIYGAMTVKVDGAELPLSQAKKILEETDRARRQDVWEKIAACWRQERETLDDVYDKMVSLRTQIARNAGFDNYRDYMFVVDKRFDYTPADCEKFHNAIEKCVVPLARKLADRRKKDLGIDRLRPWDTAVDPKGRQPLRPFETTQQLVDGVHQIFTQLDPKLAAQFDDMIQRGDADLDSHKGKAPGAYSYPWMEKRRPFVFMSAVGRHDDIATLLHESGHAFHYQACANDPIFHYRIDIMEDFFGGMPAEFCEVASMSMELFGLDHLSAFYTPDNIAIAKRNQLEGIIEFLPYMSQIDLFQHWVYTHPQATCEDRANYWTDLDRRFEGTVDWSGFEKNQEAGWQMKLHVYQYPFYYIEYGIAQLGALQLWRNFQQDPEGTLEKSQYAFTFGSSRSLPELFQAAGIQFDFSETTLQPLMQMVSAELDKLPEPIPAAAKMKDE